MKFQRLQSAAQGAVHQRPGARSPRSKVARASAWAALAACAASSIACGSSSDDKSLRPVQVALGSSEGAFYSDGELTIYQSKMPVALPIIKPTQEELQNLRMNKVMPYGAQPWYTKDDVKMQVSWTLSNLDTTVHNVEILVDPWNEFVRYWPGVNKVSDDETIPDLSGIDQMIRLEAQTRVSGVFTFDDMAELATDLATAENLIEYPPTDMTSPGATDDGYAGAGVNALVNHTFNLQNRSTDDRLIRPFIPATIAGITGFDLGLRTSDSGPCADGTNGCAPPIAIEVAVELSAFLDNRVNLDADVMTDGSGMPKTTMTAPAAPMKN